MSSLFENHAKGSKAVNRETVACLHLHNADFRDDARIAMVSLPLPMNAVLPLGFAGTATQSVDVGWWPDLRCGGKRVPRRRLLFAMTKGSLPRSFRLGKPCPPPARRSHIKVSISIVHKDYMGIPPHEVGELRFTLGKRNFGLSMGVRWRNELHWWEWLRLEQIWSGPLVSAYRVGGCIEAVPLQRQDIIVKGRMSPDTAILKSPWLHRQNWLLGEVFVLCFANGVVQLTCRHVNNHRFDEGRELTEMTPLIGLSVKGPRSVDHRIDGTQARFSLGDITLDLSDALPMVSAEHPGSLKREGDLIIYQPYEGVEIAGDSWHRQRTDGYLVRASERRIPKGIARTVRFSAGLGDVPPSVCRLTVPEWWYGLSGDLWPDGVLPVHDAWNKRIDAVYENCTTDHWGRFDENVLGHTWEGEAPYSQLLYFYRTGNIEHWRRAIRDAYYDADIAFDHSTETIRMHDYPLDGSIAPPLFRTVGLLFGHLETGDPYLLDCAESAASHWYWMDRHMWPRYAYGRDGASIRSLVFLWDYTGKEDYRIMAREAMGRMIQCQQTDGSYRDQGSGTGIHGCSHMPVKPWMANLANDPIIDYLERSPDDPELWRSFMKYCDFLLDIGVRKDGTVMWPYQVKYGDTDYDPLLEFRIPSTKGRLRMERRVFVHGHKARALNLATRHTGQFRYFDAWRKFYDSYWTKPVPRKLDWDYLNYHVFIKTLQHLPYAQAHSWNARWHKGELQIAPILSPQYPELEGTIITPLGPVTLRVRRSRSGKGKWKLVEKKGDKRIRVTASPRKSVAQSVGDEVDDDA